MKSRYVFFSFGAVLLFAGAGCLNTQSLEERLTIYEAERKVCIEEKRSSTDLTFNGQTRAWDGSDQNKAEYSCSTVDLAAKYYGVDPEGIIELCVRTELVGNYTYENGLGGAFTRSQLEQLHQADSFIDVTMDDEGRVTIGDATLENWRGLCKDVIENVLNTEE